MLTPRVYAFLADVTLVLHAGYVLFVVGGQLLILTGWARGWGWTRNPIFRFVHLTAIGFVIVEVWTGLACPLTVLENSLRALAGEAGYEMGFIRYWLARLLFYSAPSWVFTLVYTGFGLLVLLALLAYPPRRRPRNS